VAEDSHAAVIHMMMNTMDTVIATAKCMEDQLQNQRELIEREDNVFAEAKAMKKGIDDVLANTEVAFQALARVRFVVYVNAILIVIVIVIMIVIVVMAVTVLLLRLLDACLV
jgi:t-SNARE complex subunit (syntaxin)